MYLFLLMAYRAAGHTCRVLHISTVCNCVTSEAFKAVGSDHVGNPAAGKKTLSCQDLAGL